MAPAPDAEKLARRIFFFTAGGLVAFVAAVILFVL
jgi:hypothetical protein